MIKGGRIQRQRRWGHSPLTTAMLVEAIGRAAELGVEWSELSALARGARGRSEAELQVALLRLQPAATSARSLARAGLGPLPQPFRVFDLGRLSALFELMDAERLQPERLLARGVYRAGQGSNRPGPNKYDDDEIAAIAARLGYSSSLPRAERKRIFAQIIEHLGLDGEGSWDTLVKGIQRALKRASSAKERTGRR